MASVALLDANSIVQRIADYDTSSADFIPEVDEHEAYYDYVSHVIIPTDLPVQLGDVYDVATETFLRDGNAVEIPPPPVPNTYSAITKSDITEGEKCIGLTATNDFRHIAYTAYNDFALPVQASCGAWHPSQKWLMIGFNSAPYRKMYDFSSGIPVDITDSHLPSVFPGATYVRDCAWSSDGRYLALGVSRTPFVIIYDYQTGTPTTLPPLTQLPVMGRATHIAWSPNGQYFALSYYSTSSMGNNTVFYDWTSGSPVVLPLPSTTLPSEANSISWSPNSRYCVVTHVASPYMTIYDLQTGSPVIANNPNTIWPPKPCYSSVWTSDSRYLMIGCADYTYFYTYDLSTGIPVSSSENIDVNDGSYISSMQWIHDDTCLVVAKKDYPFIMFCPFENNNFTLSYRPSDQILQGSPTHVLVDSTTSYIVLLYSYYAPPYITIYVTQASDEIKPMTDISDIPKDLMFSDAFVGVGYAQQTYAANDMATMSIVFE